MNLFATDTDLLAYEPNVFVDLPFAAQRKLRVTDGAVNGAEVSSGAGGFAALEAGDVAMIRPSPAEAAGYGIESVTNDHTLVLVAEPAGLSAAEGLTVEVRTFRPQMRLTHEELMRAVGIDADDPAEELEESAIVSVGLMRDLETLGTLSRAYAAAVALAGDNETVRRKAAEYRRRLERTLYGARVLIDRDGDGVAEEWRTPGVGRMVRV